MNEAWLSRLPSFLRKTLWGRHDLQRAIGNTGWLFADMAVRMGVGLLVGVWLARYLGPERFGIYSYALAFVALFAVIANLGLDGITVRETVRDPGARDELLGTAFVLKLAGGLMAVILAITTVYVLRPADNLTFLLVAIVSVGTLFRSFDVIDLWFQAEVQSKYTVLAKITAFLLVAVAKIVLILAGASLVAFSAAVLSEAVLGAVALIIVYQYTGQSIRKWRAEVRITKMLLRKSWPVLISAAAVTVNMQVDRVMLGELSTNMEVGLYSAAARLTEIWYFIPVTIGISVMRSMTTARDNDDQGYQRKLQKLYDLMSLSAVSLALIVTLFSEGLVTLLYGENYILAADIVNVHVWSTVFVFHVSIRSRSFIINGLEHFVGLYAAIATIINVGLNAVLIPQWAGVGAAYASLLSWVIAVLVLPLFSHRTAASTGMFLRSLTLSSLRSDLRHAT